MNAEGAALIIYNIICSNLNLSQLVGVHVMQLIPQRQTVRDKEYTKYWGEDSSRRSGNCETTSKARSATIPKRRWEWRYTMQLILTSSDRLPKAASRTPPTSIVFILQKIEAAEGQKKFSLTFT
ncbi:hypothetical protein OIDMADRAFT_28399 [Oidiodendron maius Zn]|uniref:Uncharacterized protein n=1 Tax=Oidiodendron maius (strain Zn) TaxID=913774 RepID=A0A0C3H2A9_OIDMZ|nr:hypothetical protein OIDMADRAFT_28399 [Oidiodendron maius Zn]